MSAALADPEIQARLIAEALLSASVGFLVWDEDRRYIAANETACEILGTTLPDLLGQQTVGGHTETPEAAAALDAALVGGFVEGTARVRRFDGTGEVSVFYATFATKTAGMPFMATIIARLPDDQ
jgi:PAS domain-containing protein